RWLELKEQNPGKYARDIAGLMNISEAELAFARVTHDAWRMCGDIRDILAALESVGAFSIRIVAASRAIRPLRIPIW
ncbi:hypothetical protein O5472_27060, partial [Escherichia coli]|nr:hypothetical protein [Escherichia coli]